MHYGTEKIVVTGGAGFIGSHLVDRLLADTRADVVVFDNLSRGRLANLASHQAEPRLQFVEGDVRDAGAVDAVVRGAVIVYHLAAQSHGFDAVEDVDCTFTTNVVGTFNLLRAATRYGVGRVIFASSHEAYGEPIALPVEEDHPLLAIDCYGASKAAAEAYCRAFRRAFGLQTIILRLAKVYGPRDFGRVIPAWLERATAGQDLHVYGGKQVIDFVWIDQAVEALVRAAALDGSLPPINVASGTGTRIIDLARRIARLTNAHGQIKLLPAHPVEITRFVANVARMQQMLEIEPPLDPLAHLPSLLAAPAGAAS
jgi:UDP-glucose 4-epimerase